MPNNTDHVCFTARYATVPIYDEKYMDYMVYGEEFGTSRAKALAFPKRRKIKYDKRKHECQCDICKNTPEKQREYHHWQGYVEFKPGMRPEKWVDCFKWLGQGTHCAVRKGKKEEAIRYCVIDGKDVHHGDPMVQGQRNDIEEFFSAAEKTDDLKGLIRKNTSIYARTHNALDKFLAMPDKVNDPFRKEKRDVKPQCIVIYGKPGTGKSHFARQIANGNDNGDTLDDENLVYTFNPLHKDPEQYKGQGTILIQEFGTGNMPLTQFLLWVDKGTCLQNVKFKSSYLYATRFIITTNSHPSEWYKGADPAAVGGVARRVTEIHEMTQQYEALGQFPSKIVH